MGLVNIAVFSQHHVDGLDLSLNPLLYMMRCYPGVPEQKLCGHLGSFGVTGNLALQPMYTLSAMFTFLWPTVKSNRMPFLDVIKESVLLIAKDFELSYMHMCLRGKKSRVAFAKITFKKPRIILLDEPSSHLDLEAVEVLIQGLVLFRILMVSHDEHLISGSVQELWAVSEGKVNPFYGTFQDYKKLLQSSS
ncbi:hypothetical protein CRYUN_Cryun07bG0136600 [Craigia yunnanensis]